MEQQLFLVCGVHKLMTAYHYHYILNKCCQPLFLNPIHSFCIAYLERSNCKVFKLYCRPHRGKRCMRIKTGRVRHCRYHGTLALCSRPACKDSRTEYVPLYCTEKMIRTNHNSPGQFQTTQSDKGIHLFWLGR